jgi:hypothetical protein
MSAEHYLRCKLNHAGEREWIGVSLWDIPAGCLRRPGLSLRHSARAGGPSATGSRCPRSPRRASREPVGGTWLVLCVT